MQLPSHDLTPRERLENPPPQQAITSGTGLTLPPPSPEDTRDTQRFHDIMSSVLHQRPRPDDVKEALSATLRNDADRKIILSMLCENGLPYSLDAKHRRPFVDAILPHVETAGDLGWDAIVSVVESALSLKDFKLYEYLGDEFRKREVPALSVFNSAMIFNNLLCHNVAQYPEVATWVEFFKAQGTPHSFQTIHTELWRRIHRRELSSHDHLVSALCTTNNEHALDIMHASLNEILQDIRPTPKPSEATPNNLLVASCRALPLSAILVMFSVGPQHVISLTTLTISGILGITQLLLKRNLPPQTSTPPAHPSKVGAYDTFIERVYEKFCSVDDLSPRARDIKEFLDHNIENLRTIKQAPAQSV